MRRRHEIRPAGVVFTGQHRDLVGDFLRFFNLSIDIDLSRASEHVPTASRSTATLLASLMLRIERGMPMGHVDDVWIVQGDTSSALAAAYVAFDRRLALAHVEAGLRTYNLESPFPEEFNRQTIAKLATIHFAATQRGRQNLVREGVLDAAIYVTGNTAIDATRIVSNHIRRPPALADDCCLVLVTMHRRENLERMDAIYAAIANADCPRCVFVVPVHPNPGASRAANAICATNERRFVCTAPLSYEETHWMLNRSSLVLTDSGGLQEEATWYGTPVLVLRENTERMEAIEAGVSALVGSNASAIHWFVRALVGDDGATTNSDVFRRMHRRVFPFGYGNASLSIVPALLAISKHRHPPVAVSLVVHQNSSLVDGMLRSLLASDVPPLHVFVWINIIPSDVQRYFERFNHPSCQVTVLAGGDRGIVEPRIRVMHAILASRSAFEYVLELHDDMLFPPRWFSNLFREMLACGHNCAIAMPFIVQRYPVAWTGDALANATRHLHRDVVWRNTMEVHPWLLRLDVVRRIGYYDIRYAPKDHEEDDFYFNCLFNNSFDSIAVESSWVGHFGSATRGYDSAVRKEHMRLYRRKWNVSITDVATMLQARGYPKLTVTQLALPEYPSRPPTNVLNHEMFRNRTLD